MFPISATSPSTQCSHNKTSAPFFSLIRRCPVTHQVLLILLLKCSLFRHLLFPNCCHPTSGLSTAHPNLYHLYYCSAQLFQLPLHGLCSDWSVLLLSHSGCKITLIFAVVGITPAPPMSPIPPAAASCQSPCPWLPPAPLWRLSHVSHQFNLSK